jgi:protein SCO1/2
VSVGITGAPKGEVPPAPVRRRGRLAWGLVGGLALILLVAGGLSWLGRTTAKPQYGIVIDATAPAADFTLDSSLGRPVSLSEFHGQPVLLYFGYTTCPDVCPTTLADLRLALQELGDDRDKVQVLFVSVDPERDTAERLGQYLPYFDPSFIGLTGPLPEIEAIASRFGVFFQKNAANSAAQYLVDHTSAVLLLDADGALRLMFPYGTTGPQLASDTRLFIRS